MNFEKSNIVSCIDAGIEQWIGWKGFFADYLNKLKGWVEDEDKDEECYGTLESIRHNMFYVKDDTWQFFYPVEPPEEKKKDTNSCDKCKYCNSLEITKGQIDYFCRFDDNLKLTEKNYCCSDYCQKGIEPPPTFQEEEQKQEPKFRPCNDLVELAKSATDGHFTPYGGDDEKLKHNLFNSLRGKAIHSNDGKIGYIDCICCRQYEPVHISGIGWLNLNVLFEDYEWAAKKGEKRIIGVKDDIEARN